MSNILLQHTHHFLYALVRLLFDFMFPETHVAPSVLGEQPPITPVASHVVLNLRNPKCVGQFLLALLKLIPMPKVPVHKHGNFLGYECNVWTSKYFLIILAISISERIHDLGQLTRKLLLEHALRADFGHDFRALFLGEDVWHCE